VIADKNKYNIEPLGDHDRAAFSCGNSSLDQYIRERASQDIKRGLASVFVITTKEAGKYEYVGVTLLGRMAVSEKYKGTGLGALTLMEALDKSVTAAKDVASWAVFVEAIDDNAADFYRKYGFIELPEDKRKLFLPMTTIAKLFAIQSTDQHDAGVECR